MALVVFENNTAPYISAGNLNNNFNELDENNKRIGKLLWSGSFTSGSITVEGLSNYSLIAVNVAGVMCVGNASYGGCNFGALGNYGIGAYAYRFNAQGDMLTIDENNKGGTSGGSQLDVIQIYGIF